MTEEVVVVGREVAVVDLVRRLRRDPAAGLDRRRRMRAATRPGRPACQEGVPVLGGMDDAVAALERVRADAVVVASASETAGKYLRDLSWRLEGTNIEVLVAPGLVEVAPNRLQVRPTTTFPLIQVREPEFRGLRRVVKSGFDRSFAAVPARPRGPCLPADRAGRSAHQPGTGVLPAASRRDAGPEFDLLKFRSMVVDADRGWTTSGRERGQRRPVQDAPRPARHPSRPLPSPVLTRRAAPALQRPPRRHVRSSARARRSRRRSSTTGRTCTAGCWSSPASPACGRSAAGRTSPGTSRSSSTSATSRTGRSHWTSDPAAHLRGGSPWFRRVLSRARTPTAETEK